MANLAASGVTVRRTWYSGMKRELLRKDVTMVLSSMGTAANSIPATAFGLTRVYECTSLIKSSDDIVLVATPSYDGTKILLKAADTNAPADYSGTFRGVVSGI